MTGTQEDNYKMAAMILFVVIMIFFIGFLAGCGCSGRGGCEASTSDSDDDWFERLAEHGERRDAR